MPLWLEADTSIRSGVQRGRVPVLARKPEIVVMGTTACEKCPSGDQKKKKNNCVQVYKDSLVARLGLEEKTHWT